MKFFAASILVLTMSACSSKTRISDAQTELDTFGPLGSFVEDNNIGLNNTQSAIADGDEQTTEEESHLSGGEIKLVRRNTRVELATNERLTIATDITAKFNEESEQVTFARTCRLSRNQLNDVDSVDCQELNNPQATIIEKRERVKNLLKKGAECSVNGSQIETVEERRGSYKLSSNEIINGVTKRVVRVVGKVNCQNDMDSKIVGDGFSITTTIQDNKVDLNELDFKSPRTVLKISEVFLSDGLLVQRSRAEIIQIKPASN